MASTAPQTAKNLLPCDGCGRPASPGHISARIQRLQWATRFRPIHIQTLFVAETPQGNSAQDYEALFDGLSIAAPAEATDAKESAEKNFLARLSEFQRRGFYLAFLAECPPDKADSAGESREASHQDSAELCARLGPTLVKRILHSYKPKQIVLLSAAMRPLIPMLEQAGLGKELLLNSGAPFDLPRSGSTHAGDFQAVWLRAQAGNQASNSLEHRGG